MTVFRSLVLLLAILAPTFAAKRDLLDLVPPGARYVQVQKPGQFRGTPLADSWGDHPLGKELPLGGVEEVVSVGGILDDGSEPYTLFLLRVDPFVLRKFTSSASYIDRHEDEVIYITQGEDGSDTLVVGDSLMIRGDREVAAAALDRIRGHEPGALSATARSRLGVLRERSLTCTWLSAPQYPHGPEGPQSIEDQIEILIREAYSTIGWADGWIESREEFVADSPENAARLAELIRKVVQQDADIADETQRSDLLREYQ